MDRQPLQFVVMYHDGTEWKSALRTKNETEARQAAYELKKNDSVRAVSLQAAYCKADGTGYEWHKVPIQTTPGSGYAVEGLKPQWVTIYRADNLAEAMQFAETSTNDMAIETVRIIDLATGRIETECSASPPDVTTGNSSGDNGKAREARGAKRRIFTAKNISYALFPFVLILCAIFVGIKASIASAAIILLVVGLVSLIFPLKWLKITNRKRAAILLIIAWTLGAFLGAVDPNHSAPVQQHANSPRPEQLDALALAVKSLTQKPTPSPTA